MIPAFFNIMQDSFSKPDLVKPDHWDQKSYQKQKRILTRAMMKFTIEELQQIVKQHNQAYIFFDVGVDVLLRKMHYQDFIDFIDELYAK